MSPVEGLMGYDHSDILTHEVLPSALLARKTAKNLKMTRKHELGVSTAFHVDWISPFLSRKASSRRDFPSCSRLFAVSRTISTPSQSFPIVCLVRAGFHRSGRLRGCNKNADAHPISAVSSMEIDPQPKAASQGNACRGDTGPNLSVRVKTVLPDSKYSPKSARAISVIILGLIESCAHNIASRSSRKAYLSGSIITECSPPGIVCIFGEIPHQFKKCRRLSVEQAHIL